LQVAKRLSSLLLRLIGGLSQAQKQFIIMGIDVALAPISLLFAVFFANPGLQFPATVRGSLIGFVLVFALTIAGSLAMRIHKIKLKSYEIWGALKTCAIAALSVLGLIVLKYSFGMPLPGIAILVFGLIFVLAMIVGRYAMLHLLITVLRQGQVRRNVVIYGAGNTGMQIAAALRSHLNIRVVAFIDDNAKIQGMSIHGITVYSPSQIERLNAQFNVERVLLAMPSVPQARQMSIVREMFAKGIAVHALPSFAQLVGTEALVESFKPVSAGEFLGRAPVVDLQPDADVAYRDCAIMVSGAGGSVGSELCRQLLRYRPRKLVLFEVSELALYTIERELSARPDAEGITLVPLLGSVTEARLVRAVIAEHKIDVVLHAAAYKHVPLVEANPVSGLVNNVLGTRTLAEAALEGGVNRFIQISTDKAVRPTNVMGASKRMAEFVVQDMARRSESTDFSIVRFGNVLGSSGSVVPLFKEQISKGGPVTLTHEDVTRYFMTIAEAASLVLIAGGLSAAARGPHEGDLFVLDMGKPIRIRDLAERMILASGQTVKSEANPQGDIEIVVTGLRPGEKLHEELLIEPGMLTTPHEKILRVQERGLTALEMTSALRALRSAVAEGNAAAARVVIETYVEGYASPMPATGSPARRA
jgi:FlaA1/EpsC-like NDP-sugar epimerase